MGEHRVLLVPEGLEGDRVDVAVARMLGLSRSKITDLIEAGQVMIDAHPAAKSDRVHTGAMLEVRLPDTADDLPIVPQVVEGVDVIFDDDHIVVVDKPVGVAAHPSLGWDGPSVLGRCGLPNLHLGRTGEARHRPASRRGHVRFDGGGQERGRVHDLETGVPLPGS